MERFIHIATSIVNTRTIGSIKDLNASMITMAIASIASPFTIASSERIVVFISSMITG